MRVNRNMRVGINLCRMNKKGFGVTYQVVCIVVLRILVSWSINMKGQSEYASNGIFINGYVVKFIENIP